MLIGKALNIYTNQIASNLFRGSPYFKNKIPYGGVF